MRIDVVQANAPALGRLRPERDAFIRSVASPGTEIVIRVPGIGPRSIASAYEDALAAPHVLDLVVAAAEEGADAVVVNCTADTAVEAGREAVAIPVVGVSQAAFHLAAQLARRISVLTFARRIAPRFEAMAQAWGFAARLASVRSIEAPLERFGAPADLADRLAHAARACIAEDGAEALILGCTDFELAAAPLDRILQTEGLVVPIVKPFAAGLRLAETLVALGLTQSPLSYPRPDALAGPPNRSSA